MSRVHQDAWLSDDIYYHLKDYILNDVTSPAERLQLGQLSQHFGVSITPIREALIRLSAESIIESKPGRGFFYRDFLASEQASLYEIIFRTLEFAIEKASTRAPVRFLYDLKALGTPGGEGQPRPETAVRANVMAKEKLFEQIAMISGNREAVAIMRNLCERTRASRILDLEQTASAAIVVEDLKQLVIALQRGDSERAITLLREQLDKKRRRMQGIANERRRRVYEAHPLLRPGAGRQVVLRYQEEKGQGSPSSEP
jgi:DNA-binding GntR family transcriptional regulator